MPGPGNNSQQLPSVCISSPGHNYLRHFQVSGVSGGGVNECHHVTPYPPPPSSTSNGVKSHILLGDFISWAGLLSWNLFMAVRTGERGREGRRVWIIKSQTWPILFCLLLHPSCLGKLKSKLFLFVSVPTRPDCLCGYKHATIVILVTPVQPQLSKKDIYNYLSNTLSVVFLLSIWPRKTYLCLFSILIHVKRYFIKKFW